MSDSPLIDSPLSLFIERLKTDPTLRQRIRDAETSAAGETLRLKQHVDAASEANLYSIMRIAKDAGFDIDMEDVHRPASIPESPTEKELDGLWCLFTCCFVATSVWTTEGYYPPVIVPDF